MAKIVKGEKRGRPGRWLVDYRDASGVRRWATYPTKEAAEDGLAEKIKESRGPAAVGDPDMTLGEGFERYFAAKARKRSLEEDRRQSTHLLAEFSRDTKLRAITAGRIALYREKRLAANSIRRKDADGKPTKLSAASINRPLALLRHLLRLAHEDWGVLTTLPKVKLEKEPQGRIRWLGQYAPDEEKRLLSACAASKNPELVKKVTIALESRLRKGELESLGWQRNIDMTRGVFMLELTKSGRRREVPMRQAVYDILATMPQPHEGPVWKLGDIRTPFEKAIEGARLDDFHFHDCRHHFASWFVMRGGRLEALQKILGHATLAMTMKYAHLSPDYLRSEIVKTERPATASGRKTVAATASLTRDDLQVAYNADEADERRGSSEAEQLIRNQ